MEDFDFFFCMRNRSLPFFSEYLRRTSEWFAKELKEEQKGEIQLAFLQEFQKKRRSQSRRPLR